MSEDIDEPCCRDCKFRRFATAECHRHAPVATVGWPIITEDNWCGDYELFTSIAKNEQINPDVIWINGERYRLIAEDAS